MGARVTAIGAPVVRGAGHVAGWVGVGGPRQGPHGTDEWIQIGFSGFAGSYLSSLYYEVSRPGSAPRYVEIERGLEPGASRRVAVLEMAERPNWWRVWVDGRAASRPILLPSSHGLWRAVATAESWSAGRSACNGFGYRFDRIVVAQQAGGGWRALAGGLPIRTGPYRVVRPASASFVAISGKLLLPSMFRPVLSAAKPAPAKPVTPVPAAQPQPTPSDELVTARAAAATPPAGNAAPSEVGRPAEP